MGGVKEEGALFLSVIPVSPSFAPAQFSRQSCLTEYERPVELIWDLNRVCGPSRPLISAAISTAMLDQPDSARHHPHPVAP